MLPVQEANCQTSDLPKSNAASRLFFAAAAAAAAASQVEILGVQEINLEPRPRYHLRGFTPVWDWMKSLFLQKS